MIALAFAYDCGEPIDLLRATLTTGEREDVDRRATARSQRHSALGRAAAKAAVRTVLPATCADTIEVRSNGTAPSVAVNGIGRPVALSISHSSLLAAAAAGTGSVGEAVGIDVERIRESCVGESEWAFSSRERRFTARDALMAIAAWTAKEAVWKALGGDANDGPEDVEVLDLDFARGRSRIAVSGGLGRKLGDRLLDVRLRQVAGPDGMYVVSVARVCHDERGNGRAWARAARHSMPAEVGL